MRTSANAAALLIGLTLLPWCATCGPASGLHFEVAAIKPVTRPTWARGGRGGMLASKVMALMAPDAGEQEVPMPSPGRVVIEDENLLSLIAMAYRVPTAQIGGPRWMAESFFRIEALVPSGTPREDVGKMLQTLLAERLGLTLHHEIREVAGYALLLGKGGLKITPSVAHDVPAPVPDRKATTEELIASAMKVQDAARARRLSGEGASHFRLPNVSAGQLARFLSLHAQAPVADMTGLKGTYDVNLETADPAWSSFFAGVAELGLRLESRRVPTDTLVVDKADRTPTPN